MSFQIGGVDGIRPDLCPSGVGTDDPPFLVFFAVGQIAEEALVVVRLRPPFIIRFYAWIPESSR
jgi:hypothetical protein